MTKQWWKAAGIRTLKTFAETAASLLAVGQLGLLEADWVAVFSASAMAAVIAFLTCLAGLPEVSDKEGDQ